MVSALISKVIMLVFGTLYPAYRSYKAIKNKDVREYVKWMMYWIIFALFITTETFADVFLSWIPLYYEVKIVFIIWLLSPATRGSSIIYRKFIHPRLVKHEKSIDKYISEAQKNGYAALLHVGKKGLNAAGETIVKTAASGQTHLIQTLRRYNSMQDLSTDEVDARHRPQSWYYGMPAADSNFDPDDDVAVLQNQYKASRQRDFIREDSQAESAHSQADSLYDEKHNSNPALSVMNDERTDNYNENIDDADPNEIPYDSQTMPRMRKTKERKPLAGVFPDAKKTRAGRVTSRDARDQKTKSSAF